MTFLGQGPDFFDPTFKVPYVHQFSFGFQYELPLRSVIEVSCAGNRAYKLETNLQYNDPPLSFRQQCSPLEGGNPAFCDALVPNPFFGLPEFAGAGPGADPTVSRNQLNRPFPAFGSFRRRGRNDGKAWYNSLQVTYQLRGWAGLNLNVASTLSKRIEQGRNFTDGSGNDSFRDNARLIMQRGINSIAPTSSRSGASGSCPWAGARSSSTPRIPCGAGFPAAGSTR